MATLPKPNRADRNIERGGELGNRRALGAQGFCNFRVNVGIVARRAAGIVRSSVALGIF
jgi:hypothetical protein